MKNTCRGLSGNTLKIIAMISMLIDHIGFYLFPRVIFLRAIGRIAFPIFAYMIAEGYTYTRNRVRYFLLIAGLGVICQTAASLTGSWHMNVLITFALSITVISSIEALRARKRPRDSLLAILALFAVTCIAVVMPRTLRGFCIDYNEFGVLLPVLLFYTDGKWRKIAGTALMLIGFSLLSSTVQWYCLFALPLLALYNGKRGKAQLKYLFYVFYPTHQAILWLIA